MARIFAFDTMLHTDPHPFLGLLHCFCWGWVCCGCADLQTCIQCPFLLHFLQIECLAGHVWPRGVVVSALTSHVRDPGFDSRAG